MTTPRCLSVPHIGLPDLGLTLPTITLPPIPLPGVTFCCTFQLPPIDMSTINALIALAISLLPGVGKVLGPVLAVLTQFIAIVNRLLDRIQFSCPLND